jgi:methylase of polypeptide subunit release factors
LKGHHKEIPFWQYYDTGFVGKLHRWIFRARHKALHTALSKIGVKPKHTLDIGCGCTLLGFGLLTKFDLEYVGLDILPSSKLRKYAELISESAGKKL